MPVYTVKCGGRATSKDVAKQGPEDASWCWMVEIVDLRSEKMIWRPAC